MNATWISTAAALVIGGIAACDHRPEALTDYRAACLTRTDVLEHVERGRNGLSATCDEVVRARNAAR